MTFLAIDSLKQKSKLFFFLHMNFCFKPQIYVNVFYDYIGIATIFL